MLHWNIGVHFQIVALQAVMAELLGGDTVHHACGIPAFRKFVDNEDLMQTQMEVAKRVLQWRWLIIDEISMVSARLLAEVDVKLRSVIREICPMKKNGKAQDRPFGGLNVLCSGDFWQLDPPDGGFLSSIPVEFNLFRTPGSSRRPPQLLMVNRCCGAARSMACRELPNCLIVRDVTIFGCWSCRSNFGTGSCRKICIVSCMGRQPACRAVGVTAL